MKRPALQLNIWRCFYISLGFAPFLLFLEPPTAVSFYVSAIIAGVASMITSTTVLYTSKEHSAFLSSLFLPVSMLMAFTFWLLVDQKELLHIINQPIKAALIVSAMIVCNVCVFKIRHVQFTHTSLLKLIFLNAAVITLSQVVVKASVEKDYESIIYLLFIVFVVQVLSTVIWAKLRGEVIGFEKPDKNLLFLSLISAISGVCSWYAVILAPNPAYFTAVLLASPFLLTLYHRYYKHDISDSIKPGLVVTACSLVIVIFSLL